MAKKTKILFVFQTSSIAAPKGTGCNAIGDILIQSTNSWIKTVWLLQSEPTLVKTVVKGSKDES